MWWGNRRRLRVQLKLACILVALTGCATTSASKQTSELVGQSLELQLSDRTGQAFSLDNLRGEVVLLDVWATWCGPCAASFPYYAELHRELGAQGFSVVAISVDEDKAAVTEFLQDRDIPFTVLLDPQGTLPQRTGLQTMPTAYLIGRDGKVARVHEGFRDQDKAELKTWISELLEQKSPAPVETADEAPRPGGAKTSTTAS